MLITELDIVLLRNMALALFIGALVGVEREQRLSVYQFGGIRTFILIAEAGAVAGWMSTLQDSMGPFVVGGVAVAALLVMSFTVSARRLEQLPGLTTETAGLVVYFLGGAAGMGHPAIAVVLGIVTAGLLALKDPLHDLVGRIGRDDIFAGLKLLFATFIILPLLPDRTVDPWGALNPFKLWFLVTLISGLSLVGYAAVRWLGQQRGMALTGLFGGMVSSTAVTLSFSRRSLFKAARVDPLASGLILAWSVMFFRAVILVLVVDPSLVSKIVPPMLFMGVLCLGVAGVLYRWGLKAAKADDNGNGEQEDVDFVNPFSLSAAIKFGLLFAIILLAVELARQHVSPEWLYGIAALAGTTGIDAIVLSLGGLHGQIAEKVVINAIVIATLSNTVVKLGMVTMLGSRQLAVRALMATLAIGLGSVLGFGWMNGWIL